MVSASSILLLATAASAVLANDCARGVSQCATWYGEGHDGAPSPSKAHPGACDLGYLPSNPQYFVALSPADNWKRNCGRCIKVTRGSKSVVVPVVDECPECKKGHIDLSWTAFSKLAATSLGNVAVKWSYTSSCGSHGTRSGRSKSKSFAAVGDNSTIITEASESSETETETTNSAWQQCPQGQDSQTYDCKENSLWVCELGRCECQQDYAYDSDTGSCVSAPGVDDLQYIHVAQGQKGFRL
ncbi:RlpA-like double-psi beta-barrel-protein domain-containing protein-containing protein [Polychytrium aggregatum]|uniref:RlpA-like double-psi beta-barrel-protein domain-containing protein-containing protein n=1 Tax=Polychytrium aggregatum TaxID=110093 RepID=UPI0022FF0D57|nr:RlpA-like double-psi beta-barrel-protein domain-containing protein-containing protein [Polychytrium aggregatum]KAI9203372.1 RlpA-like double-psi beta-barrel-protein domain-containing protein-containing protein [Polychytrium aggregatum]